MSRKALGSAALVLALAGCSAATDLPKTGAAGAGEPGPSAAIPGNPRFFQVSPDDTYWVAHDATRDRVVSTGVRLELSPAGEVISSAWETDKASGSDLLVGGLALAPHLGGGYLFWSQTRVFRAAEFTGPLVPVGLGVPDAGEMNVRGIRNGLRGAMIATDSGPRELLPGATVATPFPDAGINDLAALDASRAIRLDAFGRPSWTVDGGKTWNDASHLLGLGVRGIAVAPDEMWFETNQGRATLGREGALVDPDGPNYRYVDYQRPFQMMFKGTRADRDEQYYWGYREFQPLQSAIASGVRLPDGSGLGVMRGAVAKVDLSTGKILSLAADWIPNGIECQPLQLDGSILFACGSDDYQGGSYVLRTDGTEPPRVERLFTDDGIFVTDDAGGFGFTGSCKAEPKFVDPDRYYGRYGRYGYDEGEPQEQSVQPVMCVRRGPDDWVERRLSLDEDTSLVAWIPRKDGTAVALVRGTGRGASLPDLAHDSQRETSQNGVRVVRVFQEVEGWYWSAQLARNYYNRGYGQQSILDRRLRALDDGTIVGWLGTSEQTESYSYQPAKWIGGALRPGGRTEVFELPATPLTMAIGGAFGVLTTREGKMYETTDRGRTWRSAGTSALSPGTMQGTCSIQGCAFSSGARLGWGTTAVKPRVTEEKREEPPKARPAVPQIVCEPVGTPKAEQSTTSPAAAQLGSQAKITLQTTFGATLEMIRETPDALSSASPYSRYGYPPPIPVPTAAPSASASAKPKGGKAAPVRTHTLVFRPPLDPLAPIARLNATNAAVAGYRGRTMAVPLLGAGNDISFLFYADQTEAIVDRNDLVTIPLFDTRRYYYYYDQNTGVAAGLRTANNRALILGDNRRRSTLEEHGASPQKPAFYYAFDRDVNRRRGLTLGRRDDGAPGFLVLDAAAPETAGVAPFDRVATALGGVTKLAPWSTLVTADDAACRADKKGYRALVNVDPSLWFSLDSAKLPGVTLGKQGIALVRWSEERVCLEGIDVAVIDPRRRADSPSGESLVVRWGAAPAAKAGAKDKDAVPPGQVVGALRSLELMQPLTCSLERPAAPVAK
jgi:hypothetical protein